MTFRIKLVRPFGTDGFRLDSNVDPAIRYLHGSHDSVVQDGVVAFPGT